MFLAMVEQTPTPQIADKSATDQAGRRLVRVQGAIDRLLVVVVVGALCSSQVLFLLVHVPPKVSRLQWALVAALGATAVSTVLCALRAGARRVALQWAFPGIGLVCGIWIPALSLTWSHPAWVLTLLFPLIFTVLYDAHLLLYSLLTLRRRRLRAVAGLFAVAATWAPSQLAPSDVTLRRARVELAAPDLVAMGEAALAADQPSDHTGPFVAQAGDGRVVGWQIGMGLLGKGTGLVWDPAGHLASTDFAGTTHGYPWSISSRFCEQITEAFFSCPMR